MIESDAPEDIVDIFIEHASDADKHKKIVGLIANRPLVEYAMSIALSLDYFNVLKVDLDFDEDSEFIIKIDYDGNITVLPATDYKLFESVDSVYISYDGDVSQDIIDWFVDHDRDVTLFGLYDEPICKKDSAIHYSTDKDGETHGFSASKSDGNSYISYSFYTTENLDREIVSDLLKNFGF